MSCILVTIIGITSWKTLNVLGEHIEEAVEESSLKTSLLYDMRIAARERNLHLIMILLAEDEFKVDEQWISFRNQGSKFLTARESFISLGLDEKETIMLENQRELSRKAVVIQYEIYNYIMENDRDNALKAFNNHLVVQAKVFKALDTLLEFQKTKNKQKLDQTKKTQVAGIRTIGVFSGVVIVIIFLITIYIIQRLSQQAVYIENESLKFKALIEGNMDSVMVLDQEKITDCNVNAMGMFCVNSLREFNATGLDYFSGFSDNKKEKDDGVFGAVNHVLVDSRRKYQWEFIDSNGRKFPADVELTGIELEGKKFVQMIIRDVTEREMIQKKLRDANENLEQKVQERTEELKELNSKIVEIARSAGMAEVASGVLHNVGNVLNSVNVTTSLLKDQVKNSKSDKLNKLIDLLEENKESLGEFLEKDEKGKLIILYMKELSKQFALDQENQLGELQGLSDNVDHIKNIISMQQTYTGNMGVVEKLNASMLFEDAIKINIASIKKHGIKLVREYNDQLVINVDKHKIVQVLVNLVSNAKYAVENNEEGNKLIIAGIEEKNNRVYFYIKDNGVGIEKVNLNRLFEFGFKKRDGGHGYGLHHSALMATEMKGTLCVESDGLGKGAKFTLDIPMNS